MARTMSARARISAVGGLCTIRRWYAPHPRSPPERFHHRESLQRVSARVEQDGAVGRVTDRRTIVHIDAGTDNRARLDSLAVEEPLEIRVGRVGEVHQPLAVT